jgi:hypothetical protein
MESKYIDVPIPTELAKELEAHAAREGMTLAGYLTYLLERERMGVDAARFDSMVHEVFGRYGEVMKRLAK